LLLLGLLLGAQLALLVSVQAGREVEGQVFILNSEGESVKFGLVPIWVLGNSEMKALAVQAVELADAAALKKQVDGTVRELRELELLAQKELGEAGARKVQDAANQERQAAEKKLSPVTLLADRGAVLIEKIDSRVLKGGPAQKASMPEVSSGNVVKVLLGLLADKPPEAESDADGRFRLSSVSSGGWVVAYRHKSVAKDGRSGSANPEQHCWLLELPQKRAQLLLSSNNDDASAAEGVLRKIASGKPPGWLLGALLGTFKRDAKVAAVESDGLSVAGTAQRFYTEEKALQDRINAEKERIAAAERAEREKAAAAERAEKERIAAAEVARKLEMERVASLEREKQEAAALEKERAAVAEARERYAQAVLEGKVALDEAGRLLRLVPGGAFQMGSREERNAPVHTVMVGPFLMGEAEVTYGEWKSVLVWAKANGYEFNNEGKGGSDMHPVTNVSWFDVLKWANAKSEKEGLKPCYSVGDAPYKAGINNVVRCDLNASGYRLPTEAEWEKAARGGVEGRPYPNGAGLAQSDANFENSGGGTTEVKRYDPNEFGLYDLAGSVWEWCWDWWGPYGPAVSDPLGAEEGESRVLRGGGWRSAAAFCRVSYRGGSDPELHFDNGGFRLVLRTVF
jgi:formylglycine-generating enzyme required for sulfatase activity